MNEVLTVYLFVSLNIGMALWLFFGPYRDYRVERVRQELFEIRDHLFDRAAAGDIDFNSRAYGLTRTTLNGMINFAHEASWFRVIGLNMLSARLRQKGYQLGLESELARESKKLSEEQQQMIYRAHLDAMYVIVNHMLHISFVFGPLIVFGKLIRETLRVVLSPFRWFGLIMTASTAVLGYFFEWFLMHMSTIRWTVEECSYEIGHQPPAYT